MNEKNKRSIPGGIKDENGIFTASVTTSGPVDEYKIVVPSRPAGTVEDILQRQLAGLEWLTKLLVTEIVAGRITKDTAQQLATLIKITGEVKTKENELLDTLSDEDLEKLSEPPQS